MHVWVSTNIFVANIKNYFVLLQIILLLLFFTSYLFYKFFEKSNSHWKFIFSKCEVELCKRSLPILLAFGYSFLPVFVL